MEAIKLYAFGTSGWLALEALPLFLTPKLIVSMAASEPRRITDLETYLCRSFGLALLVLSLLVLILTGALPLTTAGSRSVHFSEGAQTKDPNAFPVLIVTTVYHALTAFYLYTQLTYSWNFAFTAGIVGSASLFALGVWTALFGGGQGRRSKTTGADKRTSGFPFRSEESAKEIKRREKEERKREEKEEKREKEGKRKSVLRSKSYGRE